METQCIILYILHGRVYVMFMLTVHDFVFVIRFEMSFIIGIFQKFISETKKSGSEY